MKVVKNRGKIMKICAYLLAMAYALAISGCAKAPTESKTAEPYKIGVSSAMTGPAAVSYLSSSEAIRAYFAEVNNRGGIDGHPVELLIEDDRGDPGLAVANAKKLLEQGVIALIINSVSATYAPVIAEAKKANVPVFTASDGAAEAHPPEPEPLAFALHQMSPMTAPVAAVHTISQLASSPPKIGVVAIDLPSARRIGETIAKIAEARGFEAIVKVIPPTTVDYTAIADEFMSKGINWALGSGPVTVGAMLYEALQKRGYKGAFLSLYEDPKILEERKDERMFSISFHVEPLQASSLEEHQKFLDAMQKHGAKLVNYYGLWGWADARILETILRKTGWPPTTEKMLAVMNNFEFDGRPFQAPTKWKPNDHIGWVYWGTYKWSQEQRKVVPALPWFRVSPDGKTVEAAGEMGGR